MHRDKHHTEDEGRKIPVGPDLAGDGNGDGDEGLALGGLSPEDASGEVAPAGIEEPNAELDKARAEAKEYQDRYLRLYAETENFKKRMNRDSLEREKYYNETIIKELLPVLDNLERALAHAATGEGGEPGGLVEGVGMVKKQLTDALTRFGVTEVQSVGLPFDPARQQAVMQVETEDYDEGVVVEEFQKGYFLNDRILRPAMVTVAKRPQDKIGG